jgi:thiol-disulfide isomerase/thioredoxin
MDKKYVEICLTLSVEALDENIETIRSAQNTWKKKDPESLHTYFKSLLDKNPDSARHNYLYARILDNRIEWLSHARKGIKLDPEWIYSYRLLMGAYCTCLYHYRCTRECRSKLKKELVKDEHYFHNFLEEVPDSDHLLNYVFDYHLFHKRFDEAEAVYKMARKANQGWATGEDAMMLINAAKGNEKYLRKRITSMCKSSGLNVSAKSIEFEAAVIDWMDRYYKAGFAFEESLNLLREWSIKAPDNQKGGIYFDMSRICALLERDDEVFECLEEADKHDFNRPDRLEQEHDLSDLHGHPRWKIYVDKFRNNWRQDKLKRDQNALKQKTKLKIPDFKISDGNKGYFTNEDFEGKVTIFDFWSTMCSPCKKVLPILNEFLKDNPESKVQLCSVNLWDRNPVSVRSFMERNAYRMDLLFGNEDTVRTFDVRSIPTLYVIGPDGYIYYRESGYRKGLRERLECWTEDLLKTL